MWQTKYALAVPKNLGLGLNFQLCSKGYFLSAVVLFIGPTMQCFTLLLNQKISLVLAVVLITVRVGQWAIARTTNAQRGNSLHFMAKTSLPLVNF